MTGVSIWCNISDMNTQDDHYSVIASAKGRGFMAPSAKLIRVTSYRYRIEQHQGGFFGEILVNMLKADELSQDWFPELKWLSGECRDRFSKIVRALVLCPC